LKKYTSNEENKGESGKAEFEDYEASFIKEYQEEDETFYDLDVTEFLNFDEDENDEEDYTEELNSICEIEKEMADNSKMEKVFGDITNSPTKDTDKKKKKKKDKKRKSSVCHK